MRRWALAAGLGILLSGCSAIYGESYLTALQAPPPTPSPYAFPTAADQTALAPYEAHTASPLPQPADTQQPTSTQKP